ncbi:AMIN domain-containing protein [Shewanella surugensis]|uniref:AMIN domain-containing protein n=1 Tax=Shewanella surugensis TaxID=212020 RepID=A0ABT0LFL5_9GAMM|nr:AMIN domain-containing protein [Shewanella surugensis]MCL1126463.1 AMIN domain-containing protein [Shewanella surugensis]
MRLTYERMVSLVLFGVWCFVIVCTVFITVYGSGYRLNTIPIKSAIESQFGMGAEFRSFVAQKYEALKSQFFISTPSDETEKMPQTQLNTETVQDTSVNEASSTTVPSSSTAQQYVAPEVVVAPSAAKTMTNASQTSSTQTDDSSQVSSSVVQKAQGAYVTGVDYKASKQADTIQFQLSQPQIKWTGFFVNKKKAWVLDIQGNWGIDTNNIWRFDKGPVEKVVLVQYDGFVRSVLWLRNSDNKAIAPQISQEGKSLNVVFNRQ